MAFKIFCDNCDKPLSNEASLISVQEILFIEGGKQKRVMGAHFCNKDCCHSFVVKAANRPVIVSPGLSVN